MLGSLIGMMDVAQLRLATPASAVFSAARHPAVASGIAAVVPHHLARGLVGQQRQEHKPRFRPKVSDISHPNLVGLYDTVNPLIRLR